MVIVSFQRLCRQLTSAEPAAAAMRSRSRPGTMHCEEGQVSGKLLQTHSAEPSQTLLD